VRSDLDALEAAGGIRRIRGGAMLGPVDSSVRRSSLRHRATTLSGYCSPLRRRPLRAVQRAV